MYIIRKTKNDSNIIYMEYDDIAYPIKNTFNTSLNISNIYVYNKKYLPKTNNQIPFEYIFNDIANIIFNLLYSNPDDADDGAIGALLGEVDRLRNQLDSEYKEFMKREEYYMYLDKITFLKEELSNRREINKYRNSINSIITGKSR